MNQLEVDSLEKVDSEQFLGVLASREQGKGLLLQPLNAFFLELDVIA